MQVKRTETADKPKGMIERNQSVNKLNSDTLENKVDASLKHTTESGLKTGGSSVTESADGKIRYAAAQRAKIINEEDPVPKPNQSGYDDYYKKQLEEHKDEDVHTEEIQAHKSEQRTINNKVSDNTVNTAREQFLHSKQINSSSERNNKPLNKKDGNLIGNGIIEKNTERKIKTAKTTVSDDKSPLLNTDHKNAKNFKYYHSTTGQIQKKVEYNRRIQKKVTPKGLTKLSSHDIDNQRKIKSLKPNNDSLSDFYKHKKIVFEGNVSDLKKTIKLDNISYQKLRRHLRFKKLSKASAAVLGKMINISAVSLPKATLRSGLNFINTKAKSINVEDTSDMGVESAKLIYKTASEGRQLATSVKSGIKTSAKAAKNTYKVAREIPGKVRNIPKTARKVATSVKAGSQTTRKTAEAAKKAVQSAKKIAKQVQKAAKKAAEVTKKAAQAAEKAAEVTFKVMAKVAAFFVTHLPIILIVSLILIVVFLIVAVLSGMISVVSNATVGGISYAIPGDDNTPDDIAELLNNYQSTIDAGLENIKDSYLYKADRYLTENDDFYDARTDYMSGSWIHYNDGKGEESVREILDSIEIDYAEFYALLYIHLQKEKNNEDGDMSNDLYSFVFTDTDIINFLGYYFDIGYTEQAGLDCPNQDCHIEYCEGCQTRTIMVTVTDEHGNKHDEPRTEVYCPGHPYCDHEHKKVSIAIIKNKNIMNNLGFTEKEKKWKEFVEILFDDYIMGNVLNATGGDKDQ